MLSSSKLSEGACGLIFVLHFLICFQIADYDTLGSVLRIRGKNILENEYVKVIAVQSKCSTYKCTIATHALHTLLQIGAFHTLELELHRPFVLRKVCFLVICLKPLYLYSCCFCCPDYTIQYRMYYQYLFRLVYYH